MPGRIRKGYMKYSIYIDSEEGERVYQAERKAGSIQGEKKLIMVYISVGSPFISLSK